MKTYTITKRDIKALKKISSLAIEIADGTAKVKLSPFVSTMDIAVLTGLSGWAQKKCETIKADGNI